MNWFRFKIELSAWLVKTALATFSVIAVGKVLFQPVGGSRHYHVALRVVADNEWIFPVVILAGVTFLWLAYWRVIRIYRGRRAYGEQ